MSVRVKSQAEQVSHCLRNVRRYADPLDQYIYLMDLMGREERLFYKLLSENTEELMPLVGTLLHTTPHCSTLFHTAHYSRTRHHTSHFAP